MIQAKDRILVALDTPDVAKAQSLSRQLQGHVGGIKLGLEFFNALGHDGVRQVAHGNDADTPRGEATPNQPLFLDLKFHDIPNTVAGAVRSVMPLAPKILNVHASGGPAMMKAALDAANFAAEPMGIVRPMVITVTVLTSIDENDLSAVGQSTPAEDQVVRLWKFAPEPVICFDGDAAGVSAAHRAIDRIFPVLKSGYSFQFCFLPDGMDPDDLIKSRGIAGFEEEIQSARSLFDVVWDREVSVSRLDTPERKAALEKRIDDLINTIQ